MDCHYCGTRTRQWQKEVRRMKQIDLVPAQNPRKFNLLAERIIAGTWDNSRYVGRIRLDDVGRIGWKKQKILVASLLLENRFHQALHIAPYSRISNTAQIEGYLHGVSRDSSVKLDLVG